MSYEIKDNLNYGIIGNCRTSALISKTGSIDFLCLPTFSSSTAFVKLLDTKKGGSFSIEVAPDYEITQHYYHHTNAWWPIMFENSTFFFDFNSLKQKILNLNLNQSQSNICSSKFDWT